MILTGSNLKAYFEALYGKSYASIVAEKTRVSMRTVFYWTSGKKTPAMRHQGFIRRLKDERIAEIERAAAGEIVSRGEKVQCM